jgi:hypothetical protein
MNNECWLIELEMLQARFSHLGFDTDIAALRLTDLWHLYLHLSRMAGA